MNEAAVRLLCAVDSASGGAHSRERPKRCRRSAGRRFAVRDDLLSTAHIVQARHLQALQCK